MFRALAGRVGSLMDRPDRERWVLTGHCKYSDDPGQFDQFAISGGLDARFRRDFMEIAKEPGKKLGCPPGQDPSKFWLHRLCENLLSSLAPEVRKEVLRTGHRDGIIQDLVASSASFCLRLEAHAERGTRKRPPGGSSGIKAIRKSRSHKGLGPRDAVTPKEEDLRSTFNAAARAKQTRAGTVAKLIKELNRLRPQIYDDEAQYANLRGVYPTFLTFKAAQGRPDLKQKVLSINGSTRHIRLAQELAAAHHGRALSTIQDDWKDYKPARFKLKR
jgi:hypothetical protein